MNYIMHGGLQIPIKQKTRVFVMYGQQQQQQQQQQQMGSFDELWFGVLFGQSFLVLLMDHHCISDVRVLGTLIRLVFCLFFTTTDK
jgi:hypothetical protein